MMDIQFDVIEEAKKIFNTEMEALARARDSIGADFEELIELILNCKGKLVLTGMGKPGHIATKMAATFASLGTPSFFMHPGEAMHGDLGMVEEKDIVILMSYSGESEEVTRLMPVLQEIRCTTVAITGNPKSTLAKECQHHIFFLNLRKRVICTLRRHPVLQRCLFWGMRLQLLHPGQKIIQKKISGCIIPQALWGKNCLLR